LRADPCIPDSRVAHLRPSSTRRTVATRRSNSIGLVSTSSHPVAIAFSRSPASACADKAMMGMSWVCELPFRRRAARAHRLNRCLCARGPKLLRPDRQLSQPSCQDFELLVCAQFVQAVNADLNCLGVVVGDTIDVFGAAHDCLQSHS